MPYKREDVGSIPTRSTFKAPVAQWLEQGSHKPLVAGSSPAGRTKRNSLIINKKAMYDLLLIAIATATLISIARYTF